jgi:Domain of unknown function (DUF4365)
MGGTQLLQCLDPSHLARVSRCQSGDMIQQSTSALMPSNELSQRNSSGYGRPQNVADFGVDGQIEVVDDDGRPTGQLFGVQVKSGPSYFHRGQDAVAFYVDDEHLKYWDQHILPVILVLHNPQDGETIWQWASLRAAKRTGKGWRIDVPRTKTLTAASKAELRNEVWADDNVGLRHRFALDRNLMKEFEGREAFVTIDAWVNKTLMYRSIEIRFDDPMKEEIDHILPIMATRNFTIRDIMRHFVPWLDYEEYDEPEDISGEIESHVLTAWLSKAAKAFLELEAFFDDPWSTHDACQGEVVRRSRGG